MNKIKTSYDNLRQGRPTLVTIVKGLTAVFILIGMVFSAYFFLDSKHAQAVALEKTKKELSNDIAMIQKRMERNILYDHYMDLRKEIRELKSSLKEIKDAKAREYLRHEIEDLKEEREHIKRKLDKLLNGVMDE